jgi:hypothetical protein
LLVVSGCLSANGDLGRACNTTARVESHGDEVWLEARHAPLNLVLDQIASRTGVRVHVLAIPEPRISATCAGTVLEQVVECLFGPDADFIVGAGAGSEHHKLKDIWVLGANLTLHDDRGAARNSDVCDNVSGQDPAPSRNPAQASSRGVIPPPDAEETAALVEMATAQETWRRLQALTRLGGTAGPGADERIRETLTAAMSDPDPDVRAQAVAGLVRQGEGNMTALLREAMRDSHAAVRMMAVGNVSNDAQGEALLREALADSDQAVQELAAMKLEAMFTPQMTN